MSRLPDFIHIGYSKAGSSWVQGLLRSQDKIFVPPKTRYFSPFDGGCYAAGIEHYKKHFKAAKDGQKIIESDEHILLPRIHPDLFINTTSLPDVEQVVERIKKTVSNVRVIVIIRNQVDMIISRYAQYVAQGGSLTFSKFVAVLECNEKTFTKYLDYRYCEVVDRLISEFGERNVLVLPLEELKVNAERFVGSLEDFIGLKFQTRKNESKRRKKASPSVAGIGFTRLVNQLLVKKKNTRHHRTITRCPHFFWVKSVGLVRRLDNLFFPRGSNRGLMNAEESELIRAIFAEDNMRLADRLEMDLEQYGY